MSLKNTAFYIAQRYLIAKKGSTAVTFITWLAAVAMMVGVAAMFIILSVFSGLEKMNQEMIANLHADLTIKSAKGKTLSNVPNLISVLRKNPEVEHFAKTIEEKVYVSYRENGEIASLRGVDSAYTSVNPINTEIFYGSYPSFEYSNEVIMENSLDNRLAIPVGGNADFATILMPKAGTGIISKEEDIFNRKEIYVTGVFPGKAQLDNYIIAPLELLQEILQLSPNAAYEIVIKLINPENTDAVKKTLSDKLGSQYIITTKSEENAAFWKMINTEKIFIYLILGLVVLITAFNLAGAIIILQLDKKEQAKSLISLGLPLKSLRNVYFNTGLLIVVAGITIGLLIGTALCLFQMETGIFESSPGLPFPVEINFKNYVIVSSLAIFFGVLVSWIFSKLNKNNLTN